MKKLYSLITALVLILFVQSCSTDFDINGDYKEVSVVYSILDPTQQYQYIRINRAFLGEGNALTYAQIPDSTTYPYLLDVIIQAINESGQVVFTSVHADTIMVYKESDIFFTGEQPIYRIKINTPTQVNYSDTFWLDADYSYRLYIVNPVTGNIIESISPIISSFDINKPSPYIGTISFANNVTSNIEWKSAKNGKRYECKFIFTYYEIFDAAPNDTITKTMTWGLGAAISSLLSGGEDMNLSYNNHDFYYLLGNQIEERNDVERYPGNVEIVMTVGTDELNTYINVNSSSNSIIQERPQFTNISNGVGLFSSKFTKRRSYKLNVYSLDTLLYGEYTKNLNFNYYINN